MALFINLAGDMPVFQKAFFRNLVAIIMSYTILARSPEKFRFKKKSLPYMFMRALFGTISVICNFYAISSTNISDAMMLNKLSPFFAMLTSIIILKEACAILNENRYVTPLHSIVSLPVGEFPPCSGGRSRAGHI